MADLSVDMVGEVQWCRIRWQFDNIAFGCNRVNAVFKYVISNLREQVDTIIRRLKHLPENANLLIECRRRASPFLVTPVRCDAKFCLRVHILRADLDFDSLPFRPNHRCVQ